MQTLLDIIGAIYDNREDAKKKLKKLKEIIKRAL